MNKHRRALTPVSISHTDFSTLAWNGDTILELREPLDAFKARFADPPPWQALTAGGTFRYRRRCHWHTRRALLNADGMHVASVELFDGPRSES